MEAYYREIRKLKKFNGFEMHHILRRENDGTDTLAKIRSETANPSRFFFLDELHKPSIQLKTTMEHQHRSRMTTYKNLSKMS